MLLHTKKKKKNKKGKEKKITNVDKLGYLCTVGGNVNRASTTENSVFSITVCFLLKKYETKNII